MNICNPEESNPGADCCTCDFHRAMSVPIGLGQDQQCTIAGKPAQFLDIVCERAKIDLSP